MESGGSVGSFAGAAKLNVAASASAILVCFMVCAPVSCMMAPNFRDKKEILPRMLMHTKPYLRWLLLSYATIRIVLFATSFHAAAQWANYPAAGTQQAQ